MDMTRMLHSSPSDHLRELRAQDSDALGDLWGAVGDEVDKLAEWHREIAREIKARMQREEASEIPHPRFEIKFTKPTLWNDAKLAHLREFVPPEEFRKGFFPKHDEVVTCEDFWDKRVVKSWKRFGAVVQAIIKGAQTDGEPKLTIKRKKETT